VGNVEISQIIILVFMLSFGVFLFLVSIFTDQ